MTFCILTAYWLCLPSYIDSSGQGSVFIIFLFLGISYICTMKYDVYPSRLPTSLSNFLCISPTHLLKSSFFFDTPQDYISAAHGYGCGTVSWNMGNSPATTPSKNKFSSPRRYQLKQGVGPGEPSQLYQNFSWFHFAPVTTVVMGS